MLIGGIQKTTLVDYPGKVAATIFTIGCNFRCSFCHNPNIVKGIARVIPEKEIFETLKSRQKLLDAVCITGGEPTLHADLARFIRKLKKMGFLVKLDTNGTKPEILEDLIKNKLIDYVAMDIKAPWRDYSKVTCRKANLEKLKKSVTILKKGEVPYEFRATVLPALHSRQDIVNMARQIKGADKFYLQQFVPASELVDQRFIKEITYTKKQLTEIIEEFKDWFTVCKVR